MGKWYSQAEEDLPQSEHSFLRGYTQCAGSPLWCPLLDSNAGTRKLFNKATTQEEHHPSGRQTNDDEKCDDAHKLYHKYTAFSSVDSNNLLSWCLF